jgi:hypothetical protein
MSASHTLTTSIVVDVMGSQTEYEVELEFTLYPAFAGDRTDPLYPASADLDEAHIITRTKVGGAIMPARERVTKHECTAWLWDALVENEALQAAMVASAHAEIADARACRAEARRDDRMMGDDA